MIPMENKTPTSHTNYRPISLLSVPGKLMEKIINIKLTLHLDFNTLHNDFQRGFRAARETTTAIGLFYELLVVKQANKERTNVILRDISRAFDRVWHLGLKYKLIKYNLPDYLIRIITSYLTDRTGQITVNSYLGPKFAIGSGVPQGGCLSPTLFNFYTHDTPQPVGNNYNITYADDVTQIVSNRGG